MMLQSYAGFIEVMPAVPSAWRDVSFDKLRAEGAFIVSAKKADGNLSEVKIVGERGGSTKLKLPGKGWYVAEKTDAKAKKSQGDFWELVFREGVK